MASLTQDLIYVFNKNTHASQVLGEIQSDFNMSFVIDGTKDSCSVIVWGYEDTEVEPFSIVWHKKTDTWWCVSHDKVERRQNDSGYLYIHNLELLGAIEMLNARDLTDCGFNSNKYTINEFLDRLFSLSNLEPFTYLGTTYSVNYNSSIDLTQNVDFVKTFENYTLLSAIREFLDAYNCSAKLTFEYITLANVYILKRPVLNIISKSGDLTLGEYSIDYFNDIRQTKTMDKNSFGTCVVSNAENVISSKSKTFPAVGGVKTVAHEYNIIAENSIIKLPSKVFKGNWLALVTSRAFVECYVSIGDTAYNLSSSSLKINSLNEKSFQNAIDYILESVRATDEEVYTQSEQVGAFYEPFAESLNDNLANILDLIRKASTIKLYNGNELNPVDGTVIQGPNVPYLVKADYYSKADNNEPLIFCDKETKQTLPKTWTGIAWERGSDEITGFDGFEPITGRTATIVIRNFLYTDLQQDLALVDYNSSSGNESFTFFHFSNDYGTVYIRTPLTGSYNIHFRDNAQWIVNYIPMTDIKIKVDNTRTRRDIQLYNQNGKITDNMALSKLINSYSKEISSDTITKFCYNSNFNLIPQVGAFVYDDNDELYVINNVSLTFTQGERGTQNNTDFSYFIECEYTMSKYCSTKSLMVNPNSNIRDYGIPQNFNVKRKQLYRDFYELNYTTNSDNETDYYLDPSNVFVFGHEPNAETNFVSIMKLTYDISVNSSTTWYYQLETTRYNFNKMFYVVTDFNDNNIIGYGSQNVWSGFVISRVFSGTTDTLCTPISYTDQNGNVKGFDILYVDSEMLSDIYEQYLTNNSSVDDYSSFVASGRTIYNYSPFIPESVYVLASSSTRHKMQITDANYNKDALEVPVFEYACQVDDTSEVLIGDNIMTEYAGNILYFYSYKTGSNLTQHTVTTTNRTYRTTTTLLESRDINNGATIDYSTEDSEKVLTIKTYDKSYYVIRSVAHPNGGSWSNGTQRSITTGVDYAIFRHAYNVDTDEEIVDLMFIVKNVPSSSVSNGNSIKLKINHYKLN